ncbi:hypothetical protein [Lusitaniella coriacea]|uniref:hypothetical protein n=1 Tax=Lusitaniella coriacea TaxID=1983105 RepID=UPI003CEEE051
MGRAKIRAIPDDWETTYVQLAARQNFLQFLKSSNKKIKIPSTTASLSIRRKKEIVTEINQFIRQRNRSSLKRVFKNFSLRRIFYFSILFIAIMANSFRFSRNPSQHILFDKATNHLTVTEEYLFGTKMEMQYSLDRITETKIEQNKDQKFSIDLIMNSPLQKHVLGNFREKQDAEQIETCIQHFLNLISE